MKVKLLALMAFLTVSAYGLEIDYSWSWGDLGMENINVQNNINYFVNGPKLNWFETNTGLGLGLSLFNFHGNNEEMFWIMPPMEAAWYPLVVKNDRMGLYMDIGMYDKIAWGGRTSGTSKIVNTVGIKCMFSSIPVGRHKEKQAKNYNYNRYVFVEYASDNTVRIGLSFDIGLLTRMAFMDLLFLMMGPGNNDSAKQESEE